MTAAGQLLVADRVSNQILEYNLDGSFRRVLVQPSYPTLYTPSGMALGDGSDLFVASENTGTVLRYNWRTGAYMGVFASGLNGPGGLLFDQASNTLYVSEFGNYDGHQILEYNASTGANRLAGRRRNHGPGRNGLRPGRKFIRQQLLGRNCNPFQSGGGDFRQYPGRFLRGKWTGLRFQRKLGRRGHADEQCLPVRRQRQSSPRTRADDGRRT